MPNTAAITNVRNLAPTWMLKNLYAASVPAKAANVPMHRLDDQVAGPLVEKIESMNLLNAPRATPSATQKASTSGGLTTRLNELTIESAKAPSEPIVSAENQRAGSPRSR